MDELIEKKEARNINDIFKDSGEDYFRKVEKEALKEISLADNQVVSCGGGVVIDEANVNLMKDSGVLICLQARPDVIYKRVKNNKDRPLLNVENPQVKIEELLRIRRPYYQKANYIIETDNLSVQQVAQEVKSIFLK